MKKPNFFIVGAPKCGTTALSAYLSGHPNIFFCNPKEPHYFASDLDGHRPIRSLDAYLELFRKAGPQHLAVGEGSVFYLYSKNALSNIHEFNPAAKIIVMLRDPVELIQSLHQQYLHGLYENEPNLERAWGLQEKRRGGNAIPRLCRQPELLLYGEMGKLGAQLERLYSIFPDCQIKIIRFEDFVKNTAEVYRDVLRFLSVPDDGRVSFPKINEAQGFRSPVASLLARSAPVFVRNSMSKLRFSRYLQGIPRLADGLFKIPTNKKPIDGQFYNLLIDYFKSDNELLKHLIRQHSITVHDDTR